MRTKERGERVAKVAEMTSCAVRERQLRLFALLLLLILTFLVTGLGPAGPAHADDAEAQAASVALTEVSPAVPQKGDVVTLRGTVTNEGSSPIVGSSVAPRQGVSLTSRTAIDEAMTRTSFQLEIDGAIVRGHSADIGTIAPGLSRTFVLEVPVSELSLGEDGVYQLAVSLTGQTEDEQWDQVLGIDRTVVPWQPNGPDSGTARTQFTFLWPLISTAHLTAETESDEEQTPVFKDNSLLTDISPGGRLHQLVSHGADLPVTWVVDPDLLASVDAMTEEYQVRSDQGLVNGEGQQAARSWLGDLSEAVAASEVIALPFADPDLASLAHQGTDIPGSLGQLKTATEMAAVTVETVLGTEPSTDFAWPVEGAIDPSIVSVATSAGAHHIISRSDSLLPADNLAFTPTSARPIGGGVTALASDFQLSTMHDHDLTRTSDSALAHQLLLGHTLSITEQDVASERSIVVAPQRYPSSDQVEAMAAALASLQEDAGWVKFTKLEEAARAEPDPDTTRDVPGTDQYPDGLREQELPTGAFQSMRETQLTLDDFQVILTRADRVVTPFGNAIRREMSASWRGSPQEAAQYRASLQSDLEALTEQVRLIQKSPITLSGRSATIPVTVQNNLVQGIEDLELRLTSSRRLGLEVGDPQEVAINGGHSQSVKVSTTARANGRTFLEAQLYTKDGKPYGEPMRFQADVTSITSAVLMVIAGGMLLVVLAGVRMYTQRKRSARQAGPNPPSGESDTDTGGDDGDAPDEGEKLGDSE